jgi:ribosome-interacting GTPase 1
VVHGEGAAQIALVGPANAGKSLLHARLTASEAREASYPFTTQVPLPGMLSFEDVHFQLVDLPAISMQHSVPWIASTLQSADAALLVIDISDAACIEQIEDVHAALRARRVTLTAQWETPAQRAAREETDDDPFALRLPTLLLANRADRVNDPRAELATLVELSGLRYPALAVSAATGLGLGAIGGWLFEHLGVVRVYTKLPGHAADLQRPFTIRAGQTVRDVARLVHKDLEHSLRYARVWGHSGFDGQQVGPEHALADRDVVELHA